ncbi:MAG: hypothetical protein M0Z59_06155 [Nitrospiraceae bacterium]|nr:hypothetical protein [Nitrospiraceae bacterium]
MKKLSLIPAFLLAFIPALLVHAGAERKKPEGKIPEIMRACNTCHLPHAMGGGMGLKKPLSRLCLDCHPGRRGATEHVVDVAPPFAVGGLPLAGGKMTCITCHDPHGGKYGKMLRIDEVSLCRGCHKEY